MPVLKHALFGLLLGTFSMAALATDAIEAAAPAASEPTVQINLHDFMDDYAKPLNRLAKRGNSEPLLRFLNALPEFAPEALKAEWAGIVKTAIDSGEPGDACSACHKPHKRAYKRNHRDIVAAVPESLLNDFKIALKK